MKLTFEQIKEIADRYGIGCEKVKKGKEGFIIDASGTTHKSLPQEFIEELIQAQETQL